MRIAIIGIGAIGGLLAAHLAHAGEEVAIIDVDEALLSRVRQYGFHVKGPAVSKAAGEISSKPSGVFSDISEAGDMDAVFVCVKSALQERIASVIKKSWKPGRVLISFQNGIDTEELLAEVAGRDHTLRAVLNLGCHIVEPGVYSLNWFHAPNYVGALTERGLGAAEQISALLCKSGLMSRTTGEIKRLAFEKTALNATLCPICTITGLTMGEAMALPETRNLSIEILKEAIAVAEKMGWKFDRSIDDCIKYLEGGGAHKTSMALDMKAGRRTEIAFMNGKICEYGKRFGVPAPHNDAMVMAIVGMEYAVSRRSSSCA